MLTISLVDPQRLFRDALRALLEQDGFTVTAEGETGIEAVEIAERTGPTLLIHELILPELHGLEVIKRIAGNGHTRPVVLTSRANGAYALEALRHGAAGYLLKEAGREELADGLRCAANGEPYLSKELRSRALVASIGQKRPPIGNGVAKLSVRERMVLELVADGLTNSETAERLNISRRTVESHRANLMQKLGLKTQVDLVRFAIRHQIIQP